MFVVWVRVRRASVAVGLVVATVVLVVVAGSSGATGTANPRISGAAAANRAAARVDAARVLARLAVPAGAVEVARSPGIGSTLARTNSGAPVSPNVVDVHRYWRVRGEPDAVIARLEAHAPRALKVSGDGYGSGGSTDEWSVSFVLRHLRAGIYAEGAQFAATAAAGGGTALRADSWAVWLLPRPAAERIPADVRAVAVFGDVPGGPAFPVGTVTDPAVVRALVSLVDSRELAQPGGFTACGFDSGPNFDLRFLPAPGAPPVARVVEDGCGLLLFSLNGRSVPALAEGVDLGGRLWRLRILPRCGSAQLRRSATLPTRFLVQFDLGLIVRLRNVSSSVCGLEGYARVSLRRSTGRLLPTRASYAPVWPSLVKLAPHMSAGIAITWPIAPVACPGSRVYAVGVVLPHTSKPVVTRVGSRTHPVEPCNGEINIDSISGAF